MLHPTPGLVRRDSAVLSPASHVPRTAGTRTLADWGSVAPGQPYGLGGDPVPHSRSGIASIESGTQQQDPPGPVEDQYPGGPASVRRLGRGHRTRLAGPDGGCVRLPNG